MLTSRNTYDNKRPGGSRLGVFYLIKSFSTDQAMHLCFVLKKMCVERNLPISFFLCFLVAVGFTEGWKVGDDLCFVSPPPNLWQLSEDYPNYFYTFSTTNVYMTGSDPIRLCHNHCSLSTGKPLPHYHFEKDYGDEDMLSVAEANALWWNHFQIPLYNKFQLTRDSLVQISDATNSIDCGTYVFQKVFTRGVYNFIPAVDDVFTELLDIEAFEVDILKERVRPHDIILYYSSDWMYHLALIEEVDEATGMPHKISFKYDSSPVYEHLTDPNAPFYSPGGNDNDFKIYRRKPACWLFARQCHGDADGLKEGSWASGFYYVGERDLSILVDAYMVKEPPHGPGLSESQMCADFDHQLNGNPLIGYYRVGTADLTILVANWMIKEPPHGPGISSDCLE